MGTTFKELFKLYDLIQNGDVRCVETFLADTPVPLNLVLPCKGIGVLHLAVGIDPLDKSRKCTEFLLRHGAEPNLCNDDGISPVHIAAIWNRLDNLKLLIGCGGDPSLKDLDGNSAFDYAAREQQWEVYDYLRNVEDQLNDSEESSCAYTLDLDKVLVATDQIVAEYAPIPEEHPQNVTSCRKSEMIREWCEQNSLVMNKLYPTILNKTYLLENESAPWKTIDLTKNITLDLTKDRNSNDLNNTNLSFRTCLSKKSVEISGVHPLDITKEKRDSCSTCSDSQKQRLSVYENFSLPGSPNNITHINYNTKSSLKKNKSEKSSLCTDFKDKLNFDDTQSLLTSDCSLLDRALAVAQNKTNEWLSSSSEVDIKACNTRRSSASSGVSSNFSGGSIVLASVHEEYKYEDKEEDVVFIEKRLLLSPIVFPVDDAADSPDQTILSVASSLPASMRYDDKTLRTELSRLGFTPGPIQESTRTLYLKKLQALKANPIVVKRQGKTYSIELEKSLRSDEWMNNLSPYIELENKARADFTNPSKEWREGKSKTSFTYLLLDPRLTDNLPAKANQQTKLESWQTFVNSIFYVGKGKRSRPYSHLYQALTLWKRDFKTSNDKKVQHILDIWQDKVGVVCLHIFQNVIPAEAYSYEAAMIDVIGVSTLKNLKSGTYYGATSSWPLKERRMLGLYLLYKAMHIFFSEGERQLRPDDIE